MEPQPETRTAESAAAADGLLPRLRVQRLEAPCVVPAEGEHVIGGVEEPGLGVVHRWSQPGKVDECGQVGVCVVFSWPWADPRRLVRA